MAISHLVIGEIGIMVANPCQQEYYRTRRVGPALQSVGFGCVLGVRLLSKDVLPNYPVPLDGKDV